MEEQKKLLYQPSPDAPMFVVGVNQMDLKASDSIVSNASCLPTALLL